MDAELIRLITEVEQRSKNNSMQIEELKKRQSNNDKIVEAVAVLATKMDATEKKVETMDGKIDDLLSKPGALWDSLIKAAIGALVGGIIAFLLFKMGIGV